MSKKVKIMGVKDVIRCEAGESPQRSFMEAER